MEWNNDDCSSVSDGTRERLGRVVLEKESKLEFQNGVQVRSCRQRQQLFDIAPSMAESRVTPSLWFLSNRALENNVRSLLLLFVSCIAAWLLCWCFRFVLSAAFDAKSYGNGWMGSSGKPSESVSSSPSAS